jgi:hypothetical protein
MILTGATPAAAGEIGEPWTRTTPADTTPADTTRAGTAPDDFTDSSPPAAAPTFTVPTVPVPTVPGAAATTPGTTSTGWLSGVAGVNDALAEFGAWRGTPVEIVGTWADDDIANQTNLYSLQPGAELGDWTGPVDVGIGAIFDGETWAAAADGAYDDRWAQSLTVMAELRAGRGTTFIRFAHEMNGDWYDWSVNAGNAADFITAWQRFRALQLELFPAAQLVFCVNRESVGNGIDWRDTFPGAEHVDVLGVDYYNQFPHVTTEQEWVESLDDVDGDGGPKGLEAHRAFAESVGLPLAIPEWSGKATDGDSPVFMEQMAAYVAEHAGDGPGQVLYEVLFSVTGYDDNFAVWPDTAMPATAEAYRVAF